MQDIPSKISRFCRTAARSQTLLLCEQVKPESPDCSRHASLHDPYTAIKRNRIGIRCFSFSHQSRLPLKRKPATSEESACNQMDGPWTPTFQTAASIRHETRLVIPRYVPKCLVLQPPLRPSDFHTRLITRSVNKGQDTTRRQGDLDRQT